MSHSHLHNLLLLLLLFMFTPMFCPQLLQKYTDLNCLVFFFFCLLVDYRSKVTHRRHRRPMTILSTGPGFQPKAWQPQHQHKNLEKENHRNLFFKILQARVSFTQIIDIPPFFSHHHRLTETQNSVTVTVVDSGRNLVWLLQNTTTPMSKTCQKDISEKN